MPVKQVKPVTMFIYEKLKSIGQLTLSIDEHLAFFVASVVALPGTALVLCAKLAMSALECVRYLLQSALDRITSKKDSTNQFNYFVFSLDSNYRSTRETLYNLTYWPLIALFAIPSALTALTTTIVEVCAKINIRFATPALKEIILWGEHDFIESTGSEQLYENGLIRRKEPYYAIGLIGRQAAYYGILVPSVFCTHGELMGTRKGFGNVWSDRERFDFALLGEELGMHKIMINDKTMNHKLLNGEPEEYQNKIYDFHQAYISSARTKCKAITSEESLYAWKKTSTLKTEKSEILKTWLYQSLDLESESSEEEEIRKKYLSKSMWQQSIRYLQMAINGALERYKEQDDSGNYTPVESAVEKIFDRMLAKAACIRDTRTLDSKIAVHYQIKKGTAINWTEERMITWIREMQKISAEFKPIIEHMTRHATENNYEQWFYADTNEIHAYDIEIKQANQKANPSTESQKNKTSPTESVTSDDNRSNNSFDSHTGRNS